jgi:hypothetical protein
MMGTGDVGRPRLGMPGPRASWQAIGAIAPSAPTTPHFASGTGAVLVASYRAAAAAAASRALARASQSLAALAGMTWFRDSERDCRGKRAPVEIHRIMTLQSEDSELP